MNDAANVEVLELAVSDRESLARFATAENAAMGALSSSGDFEVMTGSLDALYRDGRIEPPAFIKIDIEGGEHHALMGAIDLLRHARPVILLSEHGYVQHQVCGDLLRSLGYDITVLLDGSNDGNYLVCATHPWSAPTCSPGQ